MDKIDFKLKKAILDSDFLISCKNSIFPKLLLFAVSNKQLRASETNIYCQKHLINQEFYRKQKPVKISQDKKSGTTSVYFFTAAVNYEHRKARFKIKCTS